MDYYGIDMGLKYLILREACCSQLRFVSISARIILPSCSNTGSIRDDPYWTSRRNSLELIKLSSINKVSLV